MKNHLSKLKNTPYWVLNIYKSKPNLRIQNFQYAKVQ